jgi:hypothetical protein
MIFLPIIDCMVFYDNVKNLVKTKTALTLESFIQSLGINYGTYHTQRKAGNLPRADEAIKIAAALGTSVEYLVTGQEPGKPDTAPVIQKLESALDDLKKL